VRLKNKFIHRSSLHVLAIAALFLWYPQAKGDLDDFDQSSPKPKSSAIPEEFEPNLGAPISKPTPLPSPKPVMSVSPTPSPIGKKTPNQNAPKHDTKLPINWTAKGMMGSRLAKYVDLLDEVIVTQGDIKMEADKAKVHFGAGDEVTKVVATGNVKVTKAADLPEDRMSARGNEAIFDNRQRTVTMIGRAAMWRGSDVVRAKQITYFVDTGLFRIDSGEGVVRPQSSQEKLP
jgi:lipopolysaccharide transport protein LptA